MKVCFPVIADRGVESEIYGHFASTPLFMIIDTENLTTSVVPNCDEKNPYGGCNPFSALRGKEIDAIVAGGIGDDSLRMMNMCGFRVFEAQSNNLSENLALFDKKELPEAVIQFSDLAGRCSDNDGKCNHTHDHDHDEEVDGTGLTDKAGCDPDQCNPEQCVLGHCS